jgi:spore germination protein
MHRFTHWQVILLGAAYSLDATLASLNNQVVGSAGQLSWLSYIWAMLPALLSLWLLGRIAARHPEQSVLEAAVGRFPYVGRLVTLAFVGLYFIILVRDMRMTLDFVNLTLLHLTPSKVTGVIIAATLIFICRSKLNESVRLLELWQVLLAFAIVFILLASLRDVNLEHFLPMFHEGMGHSFLGSWYIIAYLGEVVILPLLFPGYVFKKHAGFIGLGFGVLLLEILNFVQISVMGRELVSRFMYPNYVLIQQIRLTDFLDRFDLIVVSIWLPTMIIKTAFSLFFVVRGICLVVPSLQHKILSAPIGLLSLICSFWFFESAVQLFQFNRTWPALAMIPQYILPVFMYVWFRWRSKKPVPEGQAVS